MCIKSGLAVSLLLIGMTSISTAAQNKPAGLTAGDEVLITDTGSTNTTGYSIAVSQAGQVRYRSTGLITQGEPLKTKTISKPLVGKLFQDLQAAMPLAQLPVRRRFRSVSFGTSLFVEYDGQRTPDLTAPADAKGQAIRTDILGIVSALHLKNFSRHPVQMDVPGLHYLDRH